MIRKFLNALAFSSIIFVSIYTLVFWLRNPSLTHIEVIIFTSPLLIFALATSIMAILYDVMRG